MSNLKIETPSLAPPNISDVPGAPLAQLQGPRMAHFTERPFPRLFEEQVASHADKIAVVCEEKTLTFRELNARANQLAWHLRALDIGPESLVGICIDRSLEMAIGILGILKAGGAYLPLDPEYPTERLAFMLADARPALVLTKSNFVSLFQACETRSVLLDRDAATISNYSSANLSAGPSPNDLAYVIYTSGSTGLPKGAMITHGNLANYLLALNHELKIGRDDLYLHTASIAFSSSRRQLMLPLSQGAGVVIANSEQRKDPLALFAMIKECGVTVMDAVPSFWRNCMTILASLDDKDRQSLLDNQLRLILSASEPLLSDIPQTWMRQFQHPARHVHMFGQTETAGIVCLYRIPEQVDENIEIIPIGTPIANTDIYVLDENQKSCGIGDAGEMYIGGAGVGRSYLNQPQLTAEKFIVRDGVRLYRTGDWARVSAEGQIEFAGRRDQQVKLRGFRVELGEIEAALSQHPSVRECVAVARERTNGSSPTDQRLIAYFVSQGEANVSELRAFLSARLPNYSVPAAFVEMKALPLSANGKVDRLRLPEPDDHGSGLSTEFVAPQNEIEKRLASIWSQVLRVERVGRDDNFFELGGHSLLAAQIVSRVCQEFKIQMALRVLFESPTLAQIGEKVVAALAMEQPRSLPLLRPIERGNKVPLSFAQQRLWFMNQFEPDSASYNISRAIRIKGALDVEKLQRAVDEIVKRHEILRTNFVSDDGQPLQVISPSMRLPIEVTDLSGLVAGECEVEVQQLTVAEGQKPFDLTRDQLCRIRLVKLASDHNFLLLTIHHIISDGWSIGVLLSELTAVYQSFSTDQNPKLPELQIQYADFALWQRRWLQGEVLEKQLAYWRKQLRDAPAALDLPTDYPRPAVQSFRGAQQSVLLSKELSDTIRRFSRQEGVTLFMTLLAAFQTLLFRYSGQDDIVVGSPIAGRAMVETEGLIGFFVNTLVLRSDLSGNPSFRELLGRTREAALGAYTHQDVPFEKLVEELHPERSLDRTPLFQVMFALQNTPMPRARVSGLTLTPVELSSTTAKFDLSLFVFEETEGLRARLEYNTDLFAPATIERLFGHFQNLLKAIVANPAQPVAELALITESERHQLLVEWNDTQAEFPNDQSIHQLFEEQAARSPNDIAVVFADERVTYGELNARANQLARHLHRSGVGPEVRVAICVERSVDMIVGLLGILKAGGTYVPLEQNYPAERTSFILADSQAKLLLTHKDLLESLPPSEARVVCLDAIGEGQTPDTEENFDSQVTAENAAHIIYTSGSTGQPKGVVGSHRASVNRFAWMWRQYPFAAGEVCCQKTSLSFADSTWEIFGPLLQGVPLVIIPDDVVKDPMLFVEAMSANRVTRLVLVPSLLRAIIESDDDFVELLTDLQYCVCSGETLPLDLASGFREKLPHARLINLYGSSEVAADVTCYEVQSTAGLGNIPIGRPIANTQVYVLDANFQPAPVGVPGEIFVGGMGLARGYLNRPELTAEKFIPDPFSRNGGTRLFRTGDLGCRLPDGNIEYRGRRDHQVKLRGFRIELGEIEATMATHPQVRQAAVIACEDQRGDKRLVAYLVAKGEPPAIAELRAHLLTKLPDYMVPSAFVVLDSLPLTTSGKVNRLALPEPDDNAQFPESYVAPRTPVEELLSNIWMEVLRVSRVSINDNFFDLGGHSLLATQVVSRVRNTFKLEMPLRLLFELPTVALMAEAVQTAEASDRSLLIGTFERNGTAPLSFTQQQFWLLDQAEPNSSHYNVRTAIRIAGPLDVSRLQRTFEAIVARHEILRTTFVLDEDSPVQVIAPSMPLPLNVSDFSRLSVSEHEVELQRALTAEAEEPFDLALGPLLRIKLLKLDDDEHVLLVTVHHIICDAWSVALLQRELVTIYQLLGKGESSAPRLQIQYADFALWQRNRLQGKVLEDPLDYWKQQLANAPATLGLPTDYPRSALQTFNGAQESLLLPANLTHAIKTMSRREGTTLFMTLLAAFQALLFRYSGQDDIVVGSPVAGRTSVETEDLIGAFVNTVVFRGDLSGNPTFREFLGKVRETALGAYAHQEVPFEKLVEELRPDRTTNRTPLFQVMFALQNTSTPELAVEGLTLTALKLSSASSKFDLTLELEEEEEGLRASLKYNTDLFASATVERMLGHYQNLLETVVAEPERRVADLSLLTETERHQLLVDWNDNHIDFPQDACIHHLFEAQTARTPDAIAAQFRDETMSYRELNARANQLARHLINQGVGPEVLVGISIERSFEMLVAIFGVLKAGGGYVPLDPNYPRDRIASIIEDATLSVVITQKHLANDIAGDTPMVCLDEHWETLAKECEENPAVSTTSSNVALVIYTSGSTGNPKGVVLEHHSLVNFIMAAKSAYEIAADDRILQFGSLSFDLSAEEIFLALTGGGTIVLRTDEMISSARDFLRLCEEWNLSVIDLPTVYWHELTDALSRENLMVPQSIRLVIIGGEKAATDRVVAWNEIVGDRVRLLNTYGPTETTIAVTICDLSLPKHHIKPTVTPIGRPMANTNLYVLDPRRRPVPIGIPGELHIGGPGVARGYLNLPDLTSDKFIPNLFSDDPRARLYKTGDAVRYLADGNLEFLGRVDNQIKIRGFRVELEEIEQALRRHDQVDNCVVVLREDDDKRLVAYVVLERESPVSTSELRKFLKTKLPTYMVPAAFEVIDALPLMPSGKIDRRALPEPHFTRTEPDEGFAPPRTPLELVLADAWREVLKVDQIGLHENFFDLGGHSLLATRVVSHIRNVLNVELCMVDVFQAPTISGLAELLYPRIAQKESMSEFAALLEELANLSEAEALVCLDRELRIDQLAA